MTASNKRPSARGSFRPRTWAADKATAPLTTSTPWPLRPLCIPEAIGTKKHTLSGKFFLCMFVRQRLSLYSVDLLVLHLRSVLAVFPDVHCKAIAGGESTFLYPFSTSVQHWAEQVSWNYAEINEWPLAPRISEPGVLVQISPFEGVHDAQCVFTAQFQQQSSVIIYVFRYQSCPHIIRIQTPI